MFLDRSKLYCQTFISVNSSFSIQPRKAYSREPWTPTNIQDAARCQIDCAWQITQHIKLVYYENVLGFELLCVGKLLFSKPVWNFKLEKSVSRNHHQGETNLFRERSIKESHRYHVFQRCTCIGCECIKEA